MPISYVKAKLVGPYLPKNNQLIENMQLITDQLPRGLVWDKGVKNIRGQLTKGLCGVTLIRKEELKNAIYIVLKVNHSQNSLREAVKIAEEIFSMFVSTLSLLTDKGKYYFQIIESSMTSINYWIKEVEGHPSDYMRTLCDNKQPLPPEYINTCNTILGLITQDDLLKSCVSHFNNAIKYELYYAENDQKTLLEYFKCIELISNFIARQNKQDRTTVNARKEKLIDTLVKRLSLDKSISQNIIEITRANIELRLINNNLLAERIRQSMTILDIEGEIYHINKIIDIRNQILAHSSTTEEPVALENARLFRTYANKYILSYISTKHSPSMKKIQTLKCKPFRDGGYRVASRFKTEYFVKKNSK